MRRNRAMVDRVYKSDLPRLKKALLQLREEFTRLGPERTDWARLRVDPLLKHVETLERLLHSEEFSGEVAHLRKGVAMFHSDLVYLRANVKELGELLESEKSRRQSRRRAGNRP